MWEMGWALTPMEEMHNNYIISLLLRLGNKYPNLGCRSLVAHVPMETLRVLLSSKNIGWCT